MLGVVAGPRRDGRGRLALAVELFRLRHSPWLDAFRLTTAGTLLLGRIFPPGNSPAHALGTALAAGLDRGRPGARGGGWVRRHAPEG